MELRMLLFFYRGLFISACQINMEYTVIKKPNDDPIFEKIEPIDPLLKYQFLVILGGGTKENPEKTGLLLDPHGKFCQPKETLDFSEGIYGAGLARVDNGFIVCGGWLKNRKWSEKCMLWKLQDRKYVELSGGLVRMPKGADSVVLFNNHLHPVSRNKLHLFFNNAQNANERLWTYNYSASPGRVMINGFWSATPPPDIMSSSCPVAMGNKLYFFGGLDSNNKPLGNSYSADHEASPNLEWSSFSLFGPARSDAGCAVDFLRTGSRTQNALLYLAGGIDSTNKSLDLLQVADLSNGKWLDNINVGNIKANSNNNIVAILSRGKEQRHYIVSNEGDSGKLFVQKFSWTNRAIKVEPATPSEVKHGDNDHKTKLLKGAGSAVVPLEYFPSCIDAKWTSLQETSSAGVRMDEGSSLEYWRILLIMKLLV